MTKTMTMPVVAKGWTSGPTTAWMICSAVGSG